MHLVVEQGMHHTHLFVPSCNSNHSSDQSRPIEYSKDLAHLKLRRSHDHRLIRLRQVCHHGLADESFEKYLSHERSKSPKIRGAVKHDVCQ